MPNTDKQLAVLLAEDKKLEAAVTPLGCHHLLKLQNACVPLIGFVFFSDFRFFHKPVMPTMCLHSTCSYYL